MRLTLTAEWDDVDVSSSDIRLGDYRAVAYASWRAVDDGPTVDEWAWAAWYGPVQIGRGSVPDICDAKDAAEYAIRDHADAILQVGLFGVVVYG